MHQVAVYYTTFTNFEFYCRASNSYRNTKQRSKSRNGNATSICSSQNKKVFNTEAADQSCSWKKVFWKYAANYRRTPMPKCDFNKVAKLKQLYWNRTSARVFSCKFAAYFQNTFFQRTPLGGCFCQYTRQTFVLVKTSWRRLEDVICFRLQKTSWRVLEDALIKTSITCFREVL